MIKYLQRNGIFLQQLQLLIIVIVVCSMHLLSTVNAYENSLPRRPKIFNKCIVIASTAMGISFLGGNTPILPTHAIALQEPKQIKLSNEAIARIVQDDINVRQALVS